MARLLITRRVNPTGTEKRGVVSLPADRGAIAKYLSAYNAGTSAVVLQIFEDDRPVDEIPLSAGEHKYISGDALYSFKEGSSVSAALSTTGDVRVTITLEIE